MLREHTTFTGMSDQVRPELHAAAAAVAAFHPEFTYIRLKRAGGRRERPRYSLTVGTGGSSSAPRIWVTGYGIGNTIRNLEENLRRYRGRHSALVPGGPAAALGTCRV